MKFFKKKKYGKNLLVDVGSSTIKFLITEGKYPDALNVLDYRLVNIEAKDKAASQEELQEIIKHTYQSLNFKSNHANTLIRPQQEVVRVVELPDVDDEELKKAAGYQLNRYVPFGREEAIFDCFPIPGATVVNGMKKCVLVAMRRNLVESHCKIFEFANITPVVIDVEAVALMNAYIAAGARFNEQNNIEEKQNIALVHLGSSHTGLSVLRDYSPVAARAINIGAESIVKRVKEYLNVEPLIAIDKLSDVNHNDEGVNSILNDFVTNVSIELKASLLYCKREFDVDVEEIYATGGAANNKNIIRELSDSVGLPVRCFNPFENVNLSPLGDAKEDFDKNALAFVPLFALAIRESLEV